MTQCDIISFEKKIEDYIANTFQAINATKFRILIKCNQMYVKKFITCTFYVEIVKQFKHNLRHMFH